MSKGGAGPKPEENGRNSRGFANRAAERHTATDENVKSPKRDSVRRRVPRQRGSNKVGVVYTSASEAPPHPTHDKVIAFVQASNPARAVRGRASARRNARIERADDARRGAVVRSTALRRVALAQHRAAARGAGEVDRRRAARAGRRL